MNANIQIIITGAPPVALSEQFGQLCRELHEQIVSGHADIHDLAEHALQFTDVFDLAISNAGFTVHRRDNKESFMLVVDRTAQIARLRDKSPL